MVEEKKKPKIGLNDDMTEYRIDDNRFFKIKPSESANTYMSTMTKWLDLEKNKSEDILDAFKIQLKEVEIIKEIFKTHFSVKYEDIADDYSYTKISQMAITTFLGLGKGI